MLLRPSLALLALATAGLSILPAGEAPAPAPAAAPAAAGPTLPGNDMGAVVIPNLPGFVTHLEHAVNAVHPGTLAPGQLAQLVGTNLGDATLQNFAGGPAVIVLTPGLPPTIAVILSAKDPAATVAALQAANKQASAVGSMVVMAENPQGLALGTQTVPLIPNLSQPAIAGDCRLLLAPQVIANTYGPLLPLVMGGLAGMRAPNQTPAQAEAIQKLLKAELAVALAVCRDTALTVTDLRVGDQGIGLTGELRAVGASPLANALVAPTPAARAALATMASRVGTGENVIAVTACFPVKPLSTYLQHVVADQPDVAAVADDLPTLMGHVCDVSVGAQALAARLDAQGHLRLSSSSAITDAAAAKTAREALYTALVKLGGTLTPGSTSTFTPASATLALPGGGSLTVDSFASEVMVPGGKKGAMMAPMLMTEIPGASLLAQDTAEILRLAGPPHAPLVTHAEASLGGGADGYLDCDLAGLLTSEVQWMMTMRQQAAGGGALPELTIHPSGAAGLAAKWTLHDGVARWEVYLPLTTIASLANGFAAMAHVAPGGAPGGLEPAPVTPPPQF